MLLQCVHITLFWNGHQVAEAPTCSEWNHWKANTPASAVLNKGQKTFQRWDLDVPAKYIYHQFLWQFWLVSWAKTPVCVTWWLTQPRTKASFSTHVPQGCSASPGTAPWSQRAAGVWGAAAPAAHPSPDRLGHSRFISSTLQNSLCACLTKLVGWELQNCLSSKVRPGDEFPNHKSMSTTQQ